MIRQKTPVFLSLELILICNFSFVFQVVLQKLDIYLKTTNVLKTRRIFVFQVHSLLGKTVQKKIQMELRTLHQLGYRQKSITLKKVIVMVGLYKNRRVYPATETAVRTTFHMKTSQRRSASINKNQVNPLVEILKTFQVQMQLLTTTRGYKTS